MTASAPKQYARVTTGHPVDVASGVVFTAWHDFAFPGKPPFIWRRFYRTNDSALSPLGLGWSSTYFMTIGAQNGRLTLYAEEGHKTEFQKPLSGKTVENLASKMEISALDNGYVIRDWDHQRWLYFIWRPVRKLFLLESIRDRSGNTLRLSYDSIDRLDTVEQSGIGRGFQFSYTPKQLIQNIKIVIPGFTPELLVAYNYDEHCHLVSVTNSTAVLFKYSYDADHRLIHEENALEGSFFFEYDHIGRCIRTWGDGDYLSRTLKYDTPKKITRVTDTTGSTTMHRFSDSGALEMKLDPLKNATRFREIPGIWQKIDAAGVPKTKKYDERGNLVKIINTLGHVYKYEYNHQDQVSCVTDPGGFRWQKGYDDNGCLSAYSDPNGNTWRLERNARGDIINQIDPENRELKRRYDQGMRWQEISDALGYHRCEYDAKGQAVVTHDAQGILEMFKTDSDGHITEERRVDNAAMHFNYDAVGNLTRARYFNGATWTFNYDSFSRISSIVNPDGDIIRAGYDAEGRRTVVINERGEEYRDEYNALGQVVKRRFFDGRVEHYDYDTVGNLISITKSDGTIIHRKYDMAGNMIEEEAKVPPSKENSEKTPQSMITTFKYDWKGRIIKAVNADATIEFTYDPAGRLIQEKQNEFTIRYAYDKSGKLLEREFVGGQLGVIQFEYNRAGYLKAIIDKSGLVQEFTYDNTGRLEKRLMRGNIDERFTYDNRRRMMAQSVIHKDEVVVSREYEYNRADNLVGMQDSMRGQFKWQYSHTLRLTEAQSNHQVERFKYGPGGDLVQRDEQVITYQPGSRLTGIGEAIRYEYDDNGNVCARHEGGKSTSYQYDLLGQLIRVVLPDSSKVEFAYDPLGRRILKKTDAGITRFVWSNETLAAVIPHDTEQMEMLIGSTGKRPAVQWIGEEAQHFICNYLGTLQEVVSSEKGLVWSGTYLAYGKISETRPSHAQSNCFRFPGQYEDRETGLIYNRHRYYDPEQARFLTPDPIGIGGGLNLYDYPRDPVNWIDPLGFKCPNPRLVERNDRWGWDIFEHDDGSRTIRADCRRGFASRPPGSDPTLRPTIHVGEDNAINLPEAHLGRDGRLIVMEGTHRSAAASHGAQLPQDPDNPHLGGVPGRPGYMEYEYSPEYNNDSVGTPLQDLKYPPEYPHTLPGS